LHRVERVKYAVLAAAGGCEKIEEFFPHENATENRDMIAKLEAGLRAAYEAEHRQKTLRHLGSERPGDHVFKLGRQDEANLPYLATMSAVLAKAGSNTSDWSTSYSEKTASYSNGVGTTFWFRPRLYSDPTYASHYEGLYQSLLEALKISVDDGYIVVEKRMATNQGAPMVIVDVRPNCDFLRKKSVEASGRRGP
jgi:hypothetical protein